ncbi:hypothetical protein PsYK624_164440 [Phanerochaete sordida]|uniref:BTB domain-containing protein n=1 Tax=Phanerochaete sordida TaxID=48140 RepID=A0A9P3LN06_9APHY|nr:hypothetical protein PsYK624_164440 [Phanerochaete sordida]
MLSSTQLDSNARAPPPFDGQKYADIIISTSDHVDFHLVKAILSISSPFFEDMFSLVQPPKAIPRSLDRVDVSEDSTTFENLVRLCYPVKQTKIQDFALLEKVLEAAMKYQMEVVTDLLKDTLRGFVDKKPLQCYAVACRLQLEEEASLAAKTWKTSATTLDDSSDSFASTVAGGSYVLEMSTTSSAAYFRLLQYLGGSAVHNFTSPPIRYTRFADMPKLPSRSSLGADCQLRSLDGEYFPAHSVVLRLAQAGNLIGNATLDDAVDGNLPEIPVNLNSNSLRAVLNFCYPLSSFIDPPSLNDLVSVVEASKLLHMEDVEAAAKQQLVAHTSDKPLTVYLLAGLYGWAREAEEAARQVVADGAHNTYVPEMEEVPAYVYRALLKFRHMAAATVKEVISTHAPNTSVSKLMPDGCGHPRFATIALTLVEKQFKTSRTQSERRCQGCSTYYSSLFGDCPYCQRTTESKIPAVLKESAEMEAEILDAFDRLKLDLTVAPLPRRSKKGGPKPAHR